MKKENTFYLATLVLALSLLSCKNNNQSIDNSAQIKAKDSIVNIEKNILNKSKLIGNTYSLDEYHRVNFKSETTYWIYQDPRFGCSGEGSWSIENNKVILGTNDSSCETTRAMSTTYEASVFN
jgi:hypothetical protein